MWPREQKKKKKPDPKRSVCEYILYDKMVVGISDVEALTSIFQGNGSHLSSILFYYDLIKR